VLIPRQPAALLFLLLAPCAFAGGPKYIAGVTFFNPAVLGQPVHWSGGQLNYYVDQGPLNSTVTNQQATAMVDAAAALWSAVPTAGATLTDMGPLNEDVNGSNIVAGSSNLTGLSSIAQPSDVAPTATAYPLAVVYDADGSVIDALFGQTASAPTSCQNNGVWVWMDNVNPDTTIAHAVIVLNGLCATSTNLLAMMSFDLERAFGRVLGLDYSQVNPPPIYTGGTDGWPVMQPLNGICGPTGGICIPSPSTLRFDDIAALNRIYPITAQNLAEFPGKVLTAANTISIQGTVSFRTGSGMQGVNVVARPLDANGNPLYKYTVTSVSGGLFSGNRGNPITGTTDANGVPYSQRGSANATLQGSFDLSDIPLPPGVTSATYQVTFEPINPLYILEDSVGPYTVGQVTPSGTLSPLTVPNLAAGSLQTLTVTAPDSAVGGYQDAIGTQALPRPMPSGGSWIGRLSQVGQSDWFNFPVRANRTFTVVTQATDETGTPTDNKAMPVLGIWDGFDAIGTTAVGTAPALGGFATGESFLRVSTSGSDLVRIGIADQRGDGRPDYSYKVGCSTLTPSRLSVSPLPADPSSFTAWASAPQTPCSSADSRQSSPASLPTRSPRSPLRRPAASPAQSTSKWTTCPSSTQPLFSPAPSVTTPEPATRSRSIPRLREPCPSPRPFPLPSPRSAPISRPPAASASSIPSPRAPQISPAVCPSARLLPQATAAPP
jgi:hypothetical protein